MVITIIVYADGWWIFPALLRCCHVTCTTWYEFARSRGSLTDHVMRDSQSERATRKGERESWWSTPVYAALMDNGWWKISSIIMHTAYTVADEWWWWSNVRTLRFLTIMMHQTSIMIHHDGNHHKCTRLWWWAPTTPYTDLMVIITISVLRPSVNINLCVSTVITKLKHLVRTKKSGIKSNLRRFQSTSYKFQMISPTFGWYEIP